MQGVPPMRSSDPNRNPCSSSSSTASATSGNCSTCGVELVVRQGQPHAGDELAELVELGRLQGDGITGLDLHRATIVVDA